MILRTDRLATAPPPPPHPPHEGPHVPRRSDGRAAGPPPPSEPDPDGAAAVQELLGGKFGEMSTLMNYTFQSFNFRNRQGARPFYDLIANIAAEEFGHVEVVSAAINSMLTGAAGDELPPATPPGALTPPAPHHPPPAP